jgi:hypothetical protein
VKWPEAIHEGNGAMALFVDCADAQRDDLLAMRRAGHLSSRAALIYQHAAEQRDAVIAGLLSAVAAAHAEEPVDGSGTFMARDGVQEPPA